MYSRSFVEQLPEHSFFLFGPRQVGKSTLLKNIPHERYLDLLAPALSQRYMQDPSLLAREVAMLGTSSGTLIIDEIQRVPALLDVVQQLMAQYPAMRFIMSGSSARKLKRGNANLLGGRALERHLFPLTHGELGADFDLHLALQIGTLPHVYSVAKRGDLQLASELLRSYATLYVDQEIRAEALVRNLRGFQHVLRIAAAQTSEQVNLSSISRESGVSLAMVREYYSILEETLIGFFLEPWAKSTRKRLSKAPKFYFFDTGVVRAINEQEATPIDSVQRGRLFEQWIVHEIKRLLVYHDKRLRMSFFRTSHGAEVDVLLERGDTIVLAIECKSSPNVAKAELRGFQSLRGLVGAVPCVVVAPVAYPALLEDIPILPPDVLWKQIQSL